MTDKARLDAARRWSWGRGLLATIGAMLAAVAVSLSFSVHAPMRAGDAMVFAYILGPIVWTGFILWAATTRSVARGWLSFGAITVIGAGAAFAPVYL